MTVFFQIDPNKLIANIAWDKVDNLVPVIIQDAISNKVLMLGYQNPEAILQTFDQGKVTFYSRTKQRLWTKGEESGNFLYILDVALDCDRDALVYKVEPVGATCHKGTTSCFPNLEDNNYEFIAKLERIIEDRKEMFYDEVEDDSYTASLFKSGVKRIAQKLGEEAVETALAAVTNDHEELINEASDLVYHLLVLLSANNISMSDINLNLEQRHLKNNKE